MTARRWFMVIVLAALVAAFVMVVVLRERVFPLRRDPPRVVGVEVGADGKVKRRVVFEGSYRTTGWLPDPEGGHPTRIRYSHFFLEVPGSSRRELTFLPQVLPDGVTNADLCHPVEGTTWWVAAGYFRPGQEIDVVVFDPSGLRAARKIDMGPEFHPAPSFWFEDGNATLRFRTSNKGVGRYEVATDTVSP
jgi:hypothetical protein